MHETESPAPLNGEQLRKARLYRRALELACYGDKGKVAFYMSAAEAEQDASLSAPQEEGKTK